MTPKEKTRAFLHLSFAALLLFGTADSALADLRLEQKAVVGFPIRGVLEVAQIEPSAPGAHRLAVLQRNYLLGLQWSPQRNAYIQTFFVQLRFSIPFSTSNFEAGHMILADVNGDSRNDIVVFSAYPADTIAAYDSTTGALLKTFQLQERIGLVSNAVFAQNVDGKPGDEMIVTDSGISAYQGDVRLWHSTLKVALIPASAGALARGEIFTRTDTEVIVLDARTGEERRRLPIACAPAAAGQSLDGRAVIACGSASGIQLFDATTAAVRWTYASNYRYSLRNIVMIDADGDGVEDVLVRSAPESYQESLAVLNGRSGTLLGTPKSLDGGGPVLGISSGCEPPQLAVTAGGGSSDTLSLLDGTTLETKSVYAFDSYGTSGFAFADFDGDGQNELAVAHDGKMSLIRTEPLAIGSSATVGTPPWNAYRGMAAAQLDHDPSSEYVISSICGGYVGCITAWDWPSLSPLWTAPMDDGEMPRCTVVADVDGDGAADVLSASIAVHSGAKGEFVYALRGRDGKRLWTSINIPSSTGRVCVADVEGKGTPQVLALSRTIGIVRLNRSNGSVSGFNEFKNGSAFGTYKRNGDSKAKIVVAADDRLFILDDGQVKTEVHGDDVAGVTEIEIADIDGDGVPEVLLAQHRPPTPFFNSIRLQVRAIDTLAPLWTSEDFPLLANFGQVEQIAVADIDNDGMPEVLFLSSLTVRVFKTNAVAHVVTPARFDASAALSAASRVRSCCASVSLRWDHARPGTSPPLQYRVYRQETKSGHEVLLAITSSNEFLDLNVAAGARYRYSVDVVDASFNPSERLKTEVDVPSCHRTVGRR